MAILSEGQLQARNTQRAAGRSTGKAKPKTKVINFGRDEFRVFLIRSGKSKRIDHMVESISWTDPRDSAIMTGAIALRDPAEQENKIIIQTGNQIQLTWAPRPGAAFKKLWTMRLSDHDIQLESWARKFNLKNDLALLEMSEDDFKYVRDKRHKKGWRVDQIIRDVASRYGVRIGALAPLGHRVKKLYRTDTSPLTLINDVMLTQRRNTGKRYVLRWDNNKLFITPLRRNPWMIQLGPSIVSAALQEVMRENFASAVTVRSTGETRKGKDTKGRKRVKHRKIKLKVRMAASVKRYGYVHRIVYALDADSPAEARTLALRYLAKLAKPQRSFAFSHPGIPTIRKGDSIRLRLGEFGLSQRVWVAEVTHNVTANDYSMDVDVTFDDPFVNVKASRIVEALDQVAQDRGRPTNKQTTKTKPETDRAASRRTDNKPPEKTLGEKLADRGQQ